MTTLGGAYSLEMILCVYTSSISLHIMSIPQLCHCEVFSFCHKLHNSLGSFFCIHCGTYCHVWILQNEFVTRLTDVFPKQMEISVCDLIVTVFLEAGESGLNRSVCEMF